MLLKISNECMITESQYRALWGPNSGINTELEQAKDKQKKGQMKQILCIFPWIRKGWISQSNIL
jgi:hypothetical protein